MTVQVMRTYQEFLFEFLSTQAEERRISKPDPVIIGFAHASELLAHDGLIKPLGTELNVEVERPIEQADAQGKAESS